MKEQLRNVLGGDEGAFFSVTTHAPGPVGKLPLTPDLLLQAPSGDLFGMTQNVGMGWSPSRLGGKQVLIMGTMGGIRNEDGSPAALGSSI